MSIAKWTAYNAADVAVTGAALNGLASSGYAYGPEIDNSAGLFLYADLALSLSGAVTAGTTPQVFVFLLPNLDGNYAATSGNPGTSYQAGVVAPTGGAAVQFLQVRGLLLPPGKFRLVLQNNLGAALPSGTANACSLYRYAEQIV